MLSHLFTQNAKADIIEHATFYEKKLAGLGAEFMAGIQSAAEDISALPTGYASYYKSTRERAMKKFPFKLIYTIEKEIIYIHAVYPSRANPKRKYKTVKKSK
jgi:hypothetical protein